MFKKHAKTDLNKDLFWLFIFYLSNELLKACFKKKKPDFILWLGGLFTEKILDVFFFSLFFFTLVIKLYQLHFALLSSSSAIDAFKVCNLVKLSEVLIIAECG